MNLRRGTLRLGIGLTVLWLVFWTFAYVLRPLTSESAPPLPALSAATGIAVLAAAILGLPWVVSGFRPRPGQAPNSPTGLTRRAADSASRRSRVRH